MATCKALPFSSYSFAAILNPRNLSEKPKSFTFDYSYWSHNEVGISNVHTIKVNPLPWTRLEIMVAWLPVKMTSQIKFNSVIPHFWPVKYNNVIFPLYRFYFSPYTSLLFSRMIPILHHRKKFMQILAKKCWHMHLRGMYHMYVFALS